MYVSMVKANQSGNNQKSEIEQVNLVIFEDEVPKECSCRGGVFDITHVAYQCIEYAEQLERCCKDLKLNKAILQSIAMCGLDNLENIHDVTPFMTYNEDTKTLCSSFNGDYVTLDLLEDTATISMLTLLSTLHMRWFDTMIKLGVHTYGLTQFIVNNMDLICDTIYQQYQVTKLDLNKWSKISVFDKFELSFIDKFTSFENRIPVSGTTVVRNVESNNVLYIGGLSSNLLKNDIVELKYKSGAFHDYVEISLGNIGMLLHTMKVNMFYNEVSKKLQDATTVNDIIGNIKDMDVPYVPDYVDLDNFMENLKWLSLYMMDHELVDKRISHALPIVIAEDDDGNLTAIFNHIRGLKINPMYKESWFDQTFKPIVIDNIARLYNRSKMYEYKRYIGKRPDVQVLIASISNDAIQKFKEVI